MTSADRSPSNDTVLEQVSPELALVDAELATRARERLPDYGARSFLDGQELRPAPTAPRRSSEAGNGMQAQPTTTQRPPTRASGARDRAVGKVAPPQRRTRRTLVAVVSLSLLAAIAALTASTSRVSSWLAASDHAPARTAAHPPPTFESPQNRPPTAATPRRNSAPPRRTRPATTPTRGGGGGTRPATTVSRPERRRTRTAPTPPVARPRAFGWAPVRAADYYLIAFYRGREKIYEARPRRPRLALPAQWTFSGRRYRLTRGRYRWSVRAGYGRPAAARYGRVIVQATLVVPKSR